MADKEESRKKRPRSEELFFSGLQKKSVSPLNAPVWKYLLFTSAGCLLAWLLNRFIPATAGSSKTILVAVTALAAWALAVRLLFIQTRAKVFWIVWLAVGLVPLFVSNDQSYAWWAAAFLSFVFLLFRRYQPYGHLTSRRQGALFGIGLVLFVMLTFMWPSRHASNPAPSLASPESAVNALTPNFQVNPSAVPRHVLSYSLTSLRWFWFFSIFHLMFTVRLHFMKLRPKLAVAAIFLVIVPLVLMLVLGLGILYTTLSESHAARARAILDDWAAWAAADENFIKVFSSSWFTAEKSDGQIKTAGRPPAWLPDVVRSLGAQGAPALPGESPPQSAYFLKDSSLWLLVFPRPSEGRTALKGCPVDSAFLNRLAAVMRSDMRLSSEFNLFSWSASGAGSRDGEVKRSAGPPLALAGTYLPSTTEKKQPASNPPSFWTRPIYFGVTQLDVLILDNNAFRKKEILLETRRSLRTTRDELFSASNPLSVAVLASLIGLAIIFLILETLALGFGLRISGGITKGIRALHRHLCCVAEGDLDSHIEILNQDELGDLAASFNQMTAAIKQGREEAIARERLEKELETARGIQERLLPHKMPSVPGFEVSGISLPSHEVGGDYFDFLDLPTGHLGVAIADVSGKGIPAALLMANLQASLRAQDLQPESVSVIASRLNGLLVQNTDERMFVTFFYGILDKMKATFTYTNAGHNPPMLLRANGKLLRLEEGGMLLGFLSDQSYVQAAVSLEPGDVLTLFTDGITEAVNPDSANRDTKYFGEEKLVDVLRANAGRSTADIQAAVLAAVAAHTHLAAPGDDMTLVVIKRTGGHEAAAYVS